MIGGLNPYPAYKDSEVALLGEVPEHWQVARLRTVAALLVSNVDKKFNEGEQPVRLCNYVDVYKNEVIADRPGYMSATASEDEIRRFRLRAGDVVITKDSESWNDIGVPALVEYEAPDFVCGYHLAILRPDAERILGPFLLRALQGRPIAVQFHVSANGVTRYGLTQQAIKAVRIPLPPLSEQTTIARYLHHMDRRIRRYIREKRRLIALLEEQEQAVIQRAVTRGLGPDVRLKPSGVEWLGEVPEHWAIQKLRRLVDLLVSNVDKNTVEGELPIRLCNYTDVYNNQEITSDLPFMRASATPREVERFRLKAGDIVITKDSESWDDIAVPALVSYDAPDLLCAYHLAILRPRVDQLRGDFLLRVLQAGVVATQFFVAANGVTRYGLTHQTIKEIRVPVPPVQEQARIAGWLRQQVRAITAGQARLQREIGLMREYRTRLIADVVTGKLDVRGAATRLPDESETSDVFEGDEELEPDYEGVDAAPEPGPAAV